MLDGRLLRFGLHLDDLALLLEHEFLKQCTLPVTGVRVVHNIVTELAYLTVTADGLLVDELMPGVSAQDVIANTEAKLIFQPALLAS